MVDTPVSGTGGLCRAGSTPASISIFVFPGDIAQSGEHIVRIDEVTGSIPAVSTKRGSVELFFYKNEFALVYRFGDA